MTTERASTINVFTNVAVIIALLGAVWALSANMAGLEAGIENNTTAIMKLQGDVAEIRKAVAENGQAIAENGRAIAENGRAIAENRAAIAKLQDDVAENRAAIERLSGQFDEHTRQHEALARG